MLAHDSVMTWKYHRTTAPLWGKSDGHWWTLLTKSNIMELWVFLLCQTAYTVEQTVELPMTSRIDAHIISLENNGLAPTKRKPYRSQNTLAYALHYQQRQEKY